MSKSQLAKAANKTAQTILASRQRDADKDSAFDFLLKSVRTLGIAAFCLSVTPLAAQNVTKDAAGNFHQAKRATIAPIQTGKTFTDSKGNVYPVLTGAKGALYVERMSKKTGNKYRQYLPK